MPVQRADRAKSRLRPPAGIDRRLLARAIALDSLQAVRDCTVVTLRVVVTSDEQVAQVAAAAGDLVVPDPGGGLSAAIDAGLAAAATETRTAAPAGPSGTAVLLADVPSLRPAELCRALTACADCGYGLVPDTEGDGTVLLAAMPGDLLSPSFGDGSAARHEAGGAQRLDLDLPTLRRDVDTSDELRQADSLGLGPMTSILLTGQPHPLIGQPHLAGSPGGVQSRS